MGDGFDEECDYLFKAVMVGDPAVGKSNLLWRFAKKEFRLDSKPTIGVDFAYRSVRVGGKLIKAQIWDTAGQERFRAITSSYYRGALGAALVYDITRRSTFDNLQKWLREVRSVAESHVVVLLIGNKSDLGHMRDVGEEEGRKLAEEQGLFFMETSARTNLNVEEAFLRMIAQIHRLNAQRALNAKIAEAAAAALQLPQAAPVAIPRAGQVLLSIDEVSATKSTASCCYF